MVKFRHHRGTLADSMATVVEVETKERLVGVIIQSYEHIDPAYVEKEMGPINEETVEVKYYCEDERIGWSTWIVTLGGKAVGFTNGYLK